VSFHAIRLERPGQAELVELPAPAPAAGEVVVRVAAAGVCGSDVELFDGLRPPAYVRYPVVPGHEWAGTVAAVGRDVSGVAVNDRVVAEGIRWCGACERCREGATNLCEAGYAETGFTHPGAFADAVVVPARLVHRLPADADLEQAALLEPAACAAHGILAAAPAAGARVALIGGGTLGLLAALLLRLHSPRALTVIEPRADRRALALELGATDALEAAPGTGLGADLVVETAGTGTTVGQALASARRGGTVVLLGISGGGPVPFDPDVFSLGNLRVLGGFGAPSSAWQHVVALFAAGALELRPLISHRLGLDAYERALRLVGAPDAGKVLLVPERTGA
jgi:2-desacetyl-2-hydroxyethyl bacteriochlorophyllide A dehydrogenase